MGITIAYGLLFYLCLWCCVESEPASNRSRANRHSYHARRLTSVSVQKAKRHLKAVPVDVDKASHG
jgi:hypothetical protein